MPTNPLLDEFGRRLIEQVRDETISSWEMMIDGRMKGDRAKRIRALLTKQEHKKLLLRLLPEIIDSGLHHLLVWLESDEDIQVSIAADGHKLKNVAQASDGLAGELYSDEGWIAKFSEHQG